MLKKSIGLMSFALLAACSPQGFNALNDIASETVQDVACKDKNMETKLWDGLKSFLIEQKTLPDSAALKSAVRSQVEKLQVENPQLTSDDVGRISGDLETLLTTLLEEAPNGERVTTSDELLVLLSAIDVGDRTTVFRSYMQDKVRAEFTTVQKTVQSYDLNCTNSTPTIPETTEPDTTTAAEATPDANRDYAYHKAQSQAQGIPMSVFGGRWAFATAYQSCQSLQLPSMTAQTPNVQGIKIVGTHPDGVGSKRAIASLSQVQSTHYYIKDTTSYGASCFNVRQNPLIYDYGGKPYATTATDSPINLFKNSGDGTSVLGIDCSGYVFTAMAAAGLKLKSGRALKASDAWAWGSSAYVEPQSNGLTCLNKISITPTSSLRAGDIVAVNGHVILIDKAGADPFGIAGAKTTADCDKMTTSKFDFVVSQSSPSKEGIGINYFVAKDYVPTSSKMNAGLLKYAYYACLAKVNNKTYTPSLGTISVVRHNGTSDCVATRVKLSQEACVQSCGSMIR
jgi:cell wall-associated NlpC family hydrolase